MNANREDTLQLALLWHIEMQSRFVIYAADELETHRPADDFADALLRPFYVIHNLLYAAASISRALWGLEGRSSRDYARRRPLREAIGIDDNSPLYLLFAVHEGVEHYDQALTAWIDSSDDQFVVEAALVNDPPDFRTPNVYLKRFDLNTGVVKFIDHRIHIPSIICEVKRIAPRVQCELRRIDERPS